MSSLYNSPVRVYVMMFALAIWGVWSGLSLPISLFPNSSQPEIFVKIPYGDYSASEFLHSYGEGIESRLQSTIIDGSRVDQLTAEYGEREVTYRTLFQWGTDGDAALKELESTIGSLSASWPEEIRLGTIVNSNNESGGFFAISFYSDQRSIEELYNYLDPVFSPYSSQVTDAEFLEVFNPQKKSVIITLNPERMAGLRVLPSDIEQAILLNNRSLGGGRLKMGDDEWTIETPRKIVDLETVRNLRFRSRSGQMVHVRDVANVREEVDRSKSRSFRTSGSESVILFASPKPGANIKRMSDQLYAITKKIEPTLPKDIGYKILVNPSEFIDSSIRNVLKEVALAAGLAVIILFLFIGSLKNVATAAIEIPISIIMAFIFMKLTGVNINLISLGGLALSAGMNVDASVVVMENIFRHFEAQKEKLSFEKRLRVLIEAVREVQVPIIASTIASVVVFIPLLMTKGLTNSILGDLARAVVYSHGMSALVALILVPTIRLHLMGSETSFHPVSPIEKYLVRLENFYSFLLRNLLQSFRLKIFVILSILAVLATMLQGVLPKIPKELIGRPETDWIILGVSPQTAVLPQEVGGIMEKVEYEALQKYQSEVAYTFTQIHSSSGYIMMRLKNKKNMEQLWKKMEEDFVSSPTLAYWVEPWNPSELRLPDPPDFQVQIQGGTADERQQVAVDLRNFMNETKFFQSVGVNPRSGTEKMIRLTPYDEVLAEQSLAAGGVSLADLNNYLRVATVGKSISTLKKQRESIPIQMDLPQDRFKSLVDMKALPIGLGQKVVPLTSLAQVEVIKKPASVYRKNQTELHVIKGSVSQADKAKVKETRRQMSEKFNAWEKERKAGNKDAHLAITEEDTEKEMNAAVEELSIAVGISILLIFLTMIVQFGSISEALLVMLPIPFGIIGVVLSLYVFKSTLSLNSILGLILLNGIAVANSILIVDFTKRLFDEGREPIQAAIEACRVRLRPILMTSLATILGMMPIALGLGEGGKILQPLGISVSGGLWISMLLTIFIVPIFHVWALEWKIRGAQK